MGNFFFDYNLYMMICVTQISFCYYYYYYFALLCFALMIPNLDLFCFIVERRRRENINERIQELGSLLPQAMLDEITNGGSGPHSPSTSTGHPTATTTTIAGGNTSGKPNKGAILRKSVDHIKLLQQEVKAYQQHIKELESTLARYNHSNK